MFRFSRFLLILFACCTLPLAVSAANSEQARKFVNDLGIKAIDIMQSKTLSKPLKQSQLEALFENSVDIDWVSKFVLGKYWRQASDAQKSLYRERYKKFLIKHYTSKFSDYSNETFRINKVIEKGGDEYQLNMEILRPRQPSVFVDYSVRGMADGGLKIYDINVEGVSLITTQRSEFTSVVSRKGLDYLIEQLNTKTLQLAKPDTGSKGRS